MDKDKARQARELIDQVLLDNKHNFDAVGMSLHLGRGTYDESTVTFKLEVCDVSANGIVETKERSAFREMAQLYGLKPEWLDQEFETPRGEKYIVRGLKTRSSKRPVQCESLQNHQMYVFQEDIIAKLFARQESKGLTVLEIFNFHG